MTGTQKKLRHYIKYYSGIVWLQLHDVGGDLVEVILEDGSWKLLQLDEQGVWEWSEDGRHLIASSWH